MNVDAVEPEPRDGETVARSARNLGGAAGSYKTGLRHFEVRPGKLLNPPHGQARPSDDEPDYVAHDLAFVRALIDGGRGVDES